MRTGSASLTQGFARIALLDWIASDPLDGTQTAEHCRQQIADREVFDLPLAFARPDPRPPQETITAPEGDCRYAQEDHEP